tara:strand:- start:204 stop:476 length:273 start_codon:yes stop_codon:yes gene_type:complete
VVEVVELQPLEQMHHVVTLVTEEQEPQTILITHLQHMLAAVVERKVMMVDQLVVVELVVEEQVDLQVKEQRVQQILVVEQVEHLTNHLPE